MIPIALLELAVRIVPSLARWLGGSKAEETTERVTEAVRSVIGTDSPSILSDLMSDPEVMFKLKVELERVVAEREAEIRRQETAELVAALNDNQSARQQTIELAKAGSSISWAPVVMSITVTVGFILSIVLVFVIDRQWDERTAALISLLLGALVIAFGQVTNYWLGSSAGSKRSGDTVRQMAERLTPLLPAPVQKLTVEGESEADRMNGQELAKHRRAG